MPFRCGLEIAGGLSVTSLGLPQKQCQLIVFGAAKLHQLKASGASPRQSESWLARDRVHDAQLRAALPPADHESERACIET